MLSATQYQLVVDALNSVEFNSYFVYKPSDYYTSGIQNDNKIEVYYTLSDIEINGSSVYMPDSYRITFTNNNYMSKTYLGDYNFTMQSDRVYYTSVSSEYPSFSELRHGTKQQQKEDLTYWSVLFLIGIFISFVTRLIWGSKYV